MATPAEIIARWDAREKREAAVASAKKAFANDNTEQEPAGVVMFGDEPMAYYMPPGAKLYEPGKNRKDVA